MANKSFTFKIGADTSDFIKNLKKADRQINSTAKLGKELAKDVQLEFDETKFVLSQKKLRQALDQTEDKAQAIRKELKFLENSGQADTSQYEKIQTELVKTEIQAKKLKESIESLNNVKTSVINDKLDKLSNKLETAAEKTRGLSIAAGGALTALGAMAIKSVAISDDIQTYADRLGVSAETMNRWSYIAMQTDVEIQSLSKAFVKARDAIGTMMAGGTSSASKALQELMGDIKELPTDTEEAFNLIVEQLTKIEDSTLQAYYANEIFGERVATSILPMLNKSSEELEALNKEYEALNYLTNEDIAALSEFDNVMNRIKTLFANFTQKLTVELLPTFTQITNWLETTLFPNLQKLTDYIGKVDTKTVGMILGVVALTAALSPLLLIGAKLIKGASSIVSIIPKISTALTTLSAHPIIALMGTVAAMVSLLYLRNEEFRVSINKLVGTLSKALTPVVSTLSKLLTGILDVLNPIINLMGNELAKQIELTTRLLQPLVSTLEFILGIVDKIIEGTQIILGKGWLWGKDDEPKPTAPIGTGTIPINYPQVDTGYGVTNNSNEVINNSSNNSVVNNITIEANEYTTAEEVARILSLKLQSRS